MQAYYDISLSILILSKMKISNFLRYELLLTMVLQLIM